MDVDNLYILKQFFLDLFFPAFCINCNKEGSYLSQDCRAVLDICYLQYCLCNRNPKILPFGGKCERCKDKNLSGLYFALPYKENQITRKLIHSFKYQPYLKDLAKTLASILIEHFVISNKNTNDIWENSVLIPIPLDKKKIRIRGYNQSEELAKELSKILNVPMVKDNLIKTRSTKPQMELSGKERGENLKDAFVIKNPAELAGKKIFLIDDVYTTGSTMEECAEVIKNSGVKNVWGVVIAREN